MGTLSKILVALNDIKVLGYKILDAICGPAPTVRLAEVNAIFDRKKKRGRGKTWTKEEVDKLMDLYRKGQDIDRIARQLPGRTSSAVERKLWTINHPGYGRN